jgi:hypothetical protein
VDKSVIVVKQVLFRNPDLFANYFVKLSEKIRILSIDCLIFRQILDHFIALEFQKAHAMTFGMAGTVVFHRR